MPVQVPSDTTQLEKNPYLLPSFNIAILTAIRNEGSEVTQRPGIIVTVSLLSSGNGWLFQWPSTGDLFYRIVLHGVQIATVFDLTHGLQSYTYADANYFDYPPPLEIMPISAGLAPSEINEPTITIQWYGNLLASSYDVQELIAGIWVTRMSISEIGATVYSWTSEILADGSDHPYQVLAYNAQGQPSPGLAFEIVVVTPPEVIDKNFKISYDGSGLNIVVASV